MSDLSHSINNMLDQLIQAIPNIIYAALLLLLAWIIAVIVRFIITKGLTKVGVPTAMSKLPVVENPQQGKDILRTIGTVVYRSEEHTSELQSRFDLVCRLLLEKKK